MNILSIATRLHRLPLGKLRISLSPNKPTMPERIDVVLVEISTDAGLTGIGFTYSLAGNGTTLQSCIEHDLAPLLLKENALQSEHHWQRLQHRFRSIGTEGLIQRCYAALDIALWDLKGKAANLPIYQLLGAARTTTPFYLSDAGLLGRPVREAMTQAKPLLEQGALGLLVELGVGDVAADAQRIQEYRDSLGEEAWLGITANGRFDLATASAMAHFLEEDIGIDWLEDPLPAEDLAGYDRLLRQLGVPLASGSTLNALPDFRRVLESGSIRVIRPDVLRLGGITPFVKLAHLAEAYPVVISPLRLPEVGVQLACGLWNVQSVDMVPWLTTFFQETQSIQAGKLAASPQPGLGLHWSEQSWKMTPTTSSGA